MSDDLKPIKGYISKDDDEDEAILDLQRHLIEFNIAFKKRWSLVAPKRGKLKSAVVGKASDNNHLLYQDHVDAILEGCPKPITVEGIRILLVNQGEKPSTASLLAPDYFKLIGKVLDPATKRHRGSKKTLERWGDL